ncbi:5914_t:CDS:2 [Funneliformis mosseae]|uniref:5914_t:CDS:1 n=1 Tax=Funneliformis mosseae TaxID=27381 RepID=A0A9N9GC59_FUNMO|nr:5914_t:CDS:2 [Funneliformis mosseae]
MKYSTIFFFINFFVLIHIVKATRVRIHSNIYTDTSCRGDVSNFKGHVWYDTGYVHCNNNCTLMDTSNAPNELFEVHVRVYKTDQWRNSDHDVCYGVNGYESNWTLDDMDCSQFPDAPTCES